VSTYEVKIALDGGVIVCNVKDAKVKGGNVEGVSTDQVHFIGNGVQFALGFQTFPGGDAAWPFTEATAAVHGHSRQATRRENGVQIHRQRRRRATARSDHHRRPVSTGTGRAARPDALARPRGARRIRARQQRTRHGCASAPAMCAEASATAAQALATTSDITELNADTAA
jgi:hypothetical protein